MQGRKTSREDGRKTKKAHSQWSELQKSNKQHLCLLFKERTMFKDITVILVLCTSLVNNKCHIPLYLRAGFVVVVVFYFFFFWKKKRHLYCILNLLLYAFVFLTSVDGMSITFILVYFYFLLGVLLIHSSPLVWLSMCLTNYPKLRSMKQPPFYYAHVFCSEEFGQSTVGTCLWLHVVQGLNWEHANGWLGWLGAEIIRGNLHSCFQHLSWDD